MAVWQPPEEAAPAPVANPKEEFVQSWINSYKFIDNGTTSRDILANIVPSLNGHGFRYGPTNAGGYVLSISGPDLTQDFVVKSDS